MYREESLHNVMQKSLSTSNIMHCCKEHYYDKDINTCEWMGM